MDEMEGVTRYALSQLYDADFRATHPPAMKLAGMMLIPHPLRGVRYADGINPCTHAKKHEDGVNCEWNNDTVQWTEED